ncbi:hypothetical protein L7F22_037120 [Adiantum nelumboides]|nr:hypothetical protein [Adiantum nelumboides]
MESAPPNDMSLTGDPEGECIVQADDPQMTAFDGAASAGSNSCYWTSMLKLMEQGTHVPISSCMSSTNCTHNINNNSYSPGAPSMPAGQQAQQATEDLTPPPSISSPSSSSVHDQPLDMVTQNNALNLATDPDNSVWGQEFLSGPIGENKTSSIACSDDGLHELLYPRTVLELLFSDQLKLEQMPTWPDILQTHAGTSSGKSFGFPLPADRSSCEAGMSVVGHDINVSMDNPQGHMKFTQYLHSYSPLSGIDDRLSSSATSSSLSDNAIDQWAVPAPAGSSGTQCGASADDMRALTGTTMAQSSPLSRDMHHNMDHIRVKEEYSHVASPTFVSNIDHGHGCNNYQSQHHQRIMGNNMQINARGNGLEESMINNNHNEYEQKPNLLSKLWNPGVFHANDLLAHINHKQHIYESITAANFSHNMRQLAGLQSSAVNGYCNVQSFNNNNTNAVGINSGPPAALQSSYLNQLPQPAQLAKKSRSFRDVPVGGGSGGARIIRGGAHDPQLIIRKDEGNDMMLQQQHAAMMMEDDSKLSIANNVGPATAAMQSTLQRQQQQLSASEYNSNSNLNKRSRIDQQQAGAGASCTSPSASTAASTSTNHSTSSSAFKNQPVRKEKLSERIATLQQLVSPFGKTDTASVLLEAIGYIKFLQEQVQALSSPYFKSPITQNGEICQDGEERKPDLKSRGLCLVPLSCTLQVANDNGADYWYGGSFR